MRFDKALADSTIHRFNELKGLGPLDAGALYRESSNGKQKLIRWSKGHGRSTVSFGITTSKDICIVVNALIEQHFAEIVLGEKGTFR